jgi:hypothetical protein
MKHVMALFFILFSICVHAQFTKGDKFIGGQISMKHTNFHNGGLSTDRYINLLPSCGFLLNKNFALGMKLGYSNDTYKVVPYGQVLSKTITTSFSAGMFAKRFFTVHENFFFALTGDILFARVAGKSIDNIDKMTETDKSYTFDIGITPSFIFFPSSKWGIEASLGNLSYVHNQQLRTNGGKSDQINFNAGTFSLGFSYYFRK